MQFHYHTVYKYLHTYVEPIVNRPKGATYCVKKYNIFVYYDLCFSLINQGNQTKNELL